MKREEVRKLGESLFAETLGHRYLRAKLAEMHSLYVERRSDVAANLEQILDFLDNSMDYYDELAELWPEGEPEPIELYAEPRFAVTDLIPFGAQRLVYDTLTTLFEVEVEDMRQVREAERRGASYSAGVSADGEKVYVVFPPTGYED